MDKANNETKQYTIKNNMNIWSDDDDCDITSTTTSTTFDTISTSLQSGIYLHHHGHVSRSSSDSECDFDLSQNPCRTSMSNISKKRGNYKISVKVSSKKKKSDSLSTKSSNKIDKRSQNNNLSSVEKSPQSSSKKINIISNELVNISVNSARKESVSNENVQRKASIARNIFSNSSRNDTENISTQTDFSSPSQRSVQIQTEPENKIVEEPGIIRLKRPHNVATQTNLEMINEQDEQDGPARKKMTTMEVTPPRRLSLQTIHEECPILRLAEEHKNKVEAAKLNLTQVFSKASTSKDSNETSKSNTINSTQVFSKASTSKDSNEAAKSNPISNTKSKSSTTPSTTPMKQLTITDLSFCKRINRTPNVSPAKSVSNKQDEGLVDSSPTKSPIKETKTSPEKKESRYNQESHSRLYENIKKIINWVFANEHFSILFTKPETDLLKKLLNFEDKSVAIMCLRLYSRQHKWYNFKNLCEELNLNYKNLNLKKFHENLTAGFVYSDYSEEKVEDLLEYLTLPDIKDICNSLKIRVVLRKKDLIEKLLEYSKTQCTLSSLKNAHQILRERITNKLGMCIKLETNLRDVLYRIHLLYSLCNPELNTANEIYNLMYKINNELVIYPKVKTDSAIMFSTRQDFLKFTEAKILRNEFYDVYEKKNISSEYFICEEAYNRLKKLLSEKSQIRFDRDKPLFLRQFSAAWVYCKVLNAGSQNLGKHYPDDVCKWLKGMLTQEVYCVRNRGYWHSQLALVTRAHKKDVTGEAQIIIDGLRDKHVNEVQKHELSIRGNKIKKGKVSKMLHDQLQCLLLPAIEVPVSRTIQAQVVHNNEPGRKVYVRTIDEDKEYCSVEQTAINYYVEENGYTHGIHCEGQLLNALFIIFFYDIIYDTHIPNTFITELQNMPLDLFSGEFYSNRSNKIKSRLEDIGKNWNVREVWQFASKNYVANTDEIKSLINFDFVKIDTFPIIIESIGQKHLADILERFAKDYKQFHSGLPDLFLWNHRNFKCCFVEVKSETDKLSTKQLLWINYLHRLGVKVEVCHVEHIGSTSTKKMKN